MRVRFVRNSFDGLGLDRQTIDYYEYIYRPSEPSEKPKGYAGGLIELGDEFTVYAMSITGSVTQYFVREPRHGSITHFAATAFDVIDSRVSSLWRY